MDETQVKEISELESATAVNDADLFVVQQGGVAKQVPGSVLKAAFGGSATSLDLDTTLTVEGAAADAKAVGDEFTAVREEMAALEEPTVTALTINAEDGTFTEELSDGTSTAGAMEFDDNGYPTAVTYGSVTIPITWEGV